MAEQPWGVHRPSTLAEALAARAAGAAVFAGGTDLMVKRRTVTGGLADFPGPVVLLDGIRELAGVCLRDGVIEIRSMTTLAQVAGCDLAPRILRDIVLEMGGPALRNAATMGGNVCNASPAADTLPFLYAWEATVVLSSLDADGRVTERSLPIHTFITGPGATALAPAEILTSIRVADRKPTVFHWRKVGTRKANALTKVSIAAWAEVEAGRILTARIALGAVGPTVVRLTEVERLAEGSDRETRGSPGFRDRVREACLSAVHPIDDQRSTADYRRTVSAGLTWEFLARI